MPSVPGINNSIQKKFFRALAAVTILFVAVVTILSYFGAKKELETMTRNNLKVLSESIYQSMTNTMLTGSPEFVTEAESQAKHLQGVEHLKIHKSKLVMQDFGLKESSLTQDPQILEVFRDHKSRIREINSENHHQMQILRPFIAEKRCLNCHVSAKEGDTLGVMDLRVSLEENDKNIAYFTRMISGTNIFLAILLVGAVLFLLHRLVTAPLQKLIALIASLSRGNRDLTRRVEVQSDDEVGKIAEEFNLYLQMIEENQKEERAFISKAQETIERAKNGCFSTTIDAETSSETLNEFKNAVNDMLHVTMQNFDHINTILTQYASHNYTADIELKNVEPGSALHRLIVHINKLKSVITEMLVENKKTNLKLYDFSDVLLKNVERLNMSTQETEAALQDVNHSMEQITDNIHNNNRNVTVMSNLASGVTTSAKEGEKMADKTTDAMNAINEQVNAINEAITVINQIAFQTNILSLNAAVEAATAGEAGKGFAVVATEVRNLATKSAEAARKIQDLVENASNMADEGKKIAAHMREGYDLLNRNISDTVKHINEIKDASNDQLHAITVINKNITKVTKFTHENSDITQKTKDVALKTDEMAKYAVKQIDEKSFEGKEQISH